MNSDAAASASWRRLIGTVPACPASPVKVTLTGVRYTVNVISSGTKPTAAEPRTFTVQ